MKKFKVEFDFVTTYVGRVEADSVEEVKKIVCNGNLNPNNVETAIGETKIQFIEEIKDGRKI